VSGTYPGKCHVRTWVSVRWVSVTDCGHVGAEATVDACAITWTESSAGKVAAHRRPGGQGLSLIDRIVTARGGTLAIDWRDNGLAVVLRFAVA
jgi:two-component sensor histidine kinase